METEHQAPRSIDHLVLPVGSLDVARARLSALGFIVAADAIHPFGTENACVFFADETYLEPLAVASREDCEAAAKAGNVFVARDQAFRFRKGEGLSAIVVKSDDAFADDSRFRTQGFGAGDMLEFARLMRFPDGREINAAFKLAFAADLRGPDFFLFACQRINALPRDRGALLVHDNGVVGISRVVLVEDNPSDFQYLLDWLDEAQLDRVGATLRRCSLSRAWPIKFVAGEWDNERIRSVSRLSPQMLPLMR